MGADGGSIAGRRDLVKEKQKEITTSKLYDIRDLDHVDLWTRCALSGKKLHSDTGSGGVSSSNPVVSDFKGRLYAKEAILEWLLERKKIAVDKPKFKDMNDEKEQTDDLVFTDQQAQLVSHITSLKDVVELKLHYDSEGQWTCPLTLRNVLIESATRPFVYLVPCGHFMCESALKEFDSCPQCLCEPKPKYNPETQIIPVNSKSLSTLQKLKERMAKLKSQDQTHSLKPVQKKISKKRKVLPRDDPSSVHQRKKKPILTN